MCSGSLSHYFHWANGPRGRVASDAGATPPRHNKGFARRRLGGAGAGPQATPEPRRHATINGSQGVGWGRGRVVSDAGATPPRQNEGFARRRLGGAGAASQATPEPRRHAIIKGSQGVGWGRGARATARLTPHSHHIPPNSQHTVNIQSTYSQHTVNIS